MIPDQIFRELLHRQYEPKRVRIILEQCDRAEQSMGLQTMVGNLGLQPIELTLPSPESHQLEVGNWYMVVATEQSYTLSAIGLGEYLVGRAPQCKIILGHNWVSRQHALVTIHQDRVTIRDLASRNGTYVDGIRIQSDGVRAENKRIRITNFLLQFWFVPMP